MSKFVVSSGLIPFLSGWPRRAAALLCLFAAAASIVLGSHSHPGHRRIVVATHALNAGAVLSVGDLKLIVWPDDAPPSFAADSAADLVGRRTAVAVARGAPIGNETLLAPAIAKVLAAGEVAATVQLANTNSLAVIRGGSYVDLYVNADSPELVEGKSIGVNSGSTPVASSVLVLAALQGNDKSEANTDPTLIIAVDRPTAAKLSAPATGTFVATLVEPP